MDQNCKTGTEGSLYYPSNNDSNTHNDSWQKLAWLKDIEITEALQDQINQLANFIIVEFPDEIGKHNSEGAVECAIRLLKKYKESK
jgi:hypothetical protein